MQLGERLRALRQEKSLTQSQLGSHFNLAESTISLYESGKRSPDYEMLKKFALFFNVTTDYLLGYTEDICPRVFTEEEFSENSTNDETKTIYRTLPVLSDIRPGQKIFSHEYCSDRECVCGDNLLNDKYYWLRIRDDSMKNDYIIPGDLCLIKETTQVKNGEIALVSVDNDTGKLFRIYRKDSTIVLQPSNTAYPVKIYAGGESLKIKVMGKALEVKRKL